MHQRQPYITGTSRSTVGRFVEGQIVAALSHVVVDLQTQDHDTTGSLSWEHALASPLLDAALQVRELLSEAIAAAGSAGLLHSSSQSHPINRAASYSLRRRGLA
jgi:hypothetical protein